MKIFKIITVSFIAAAFWASIATSWAQLGVRTIDARTGIFGAGNNGISSDGSGLAPSPFVLNPGVNRTLLFSSVTGTIGAVGQQSFGPDGGNFANIPVNISSYGGISGIIDNSVNNNLCLLGVFTSGTPSGPAPARLDITAAHSASTIFPLLNQTFFVGDGLTGTGSGIIQNFRVPDGASAFYLGFADGVIFQGAPSTYDNNAGVLTATFNVVPEPSTKLIAFLAFSGACYLRGRFRGVSRSWTSPVAIFIATVTILLAGCASPPRLQSGRVPPGSLRLAQVVSFATRKEILEAKKAYDLILASGISDPEIKDSSIAIGRVYCCGGPSAKTSPLVFYIPPGLQIIRGDFIELQIGHPAKKGEPGKLNTVTQLRQRGENKPGGLQWNPPDDRLWRRTLYGNWMPKEGWVYQGGIWNTWYKPPVSSNFQNHEFN